MGVSDKPDFKEIKRKNNRCYPAQNTASRINRMMITMNQVKPSRWLQTLAALLSTWEQRNGG